MSNGFEITPARRREIAAIRKAAKAAIREHVAVFGMVTEREMYRFCAAYRAQTGLTDRDAYQADDAILSALVTMERKGTRADHADAYDPS